jgi:hypothetical protein
VGGWANSSSKAFGVSVADKPKAKREKEKSRESYVERVKERERERERERDREREIKIEWGTAASQFNEVDYETLTIFSLARSATTPQWAKTIRRATTKKYI